MNGRIAGRLRQLAALTVGFSLLTAMIGLVLVLSPPALAAPQNDTVIVPSGSPVEIALMTWNDWGPAADIATAVQMAMDDYGPIKGFALMLNGYDAGCDPTNGANAASLVVANPQNAGALGPICSSTATGAAPVLETAGVVMVSATATREDLPTFGPTVFNRVVLGDARFDPWHRLVSDLLSALTWAADFEATYGHPPDSFANYAYDAATVLLTRIDQVSTLDSGNLVIGRAALAAAVRGTTGLPGATGSISLDSDTGNRIDELTGTGTRYVATTGADGGNNCTSPAGPCASVQWALDVANGGESVLIAQGTYTENLTVQKDMELYGGYEASTWTRDLAQYETIVDGSGGQVVVGEWDGGQVVKAGVIRDDTGYKMWFDGANVLGEPQIGLATSSDGISWTKSLNNPVWAGTPGEWDGDSPEHAPFVLKEGPTYKMWYEGRGNGGTRQLGYAHSSNGVDWIEHPGNPVLQAGPEGYDQEVAGHGTVLHEGGTYKLWYHAAGDQGPIIAYATSLDGLNWLKQGPVLLPDGGGWDQFAVWGPSVLNLGGTYWMWYGGAGPAGPPAIGVITSTDGLNWNRFLATPVLTETTPIGDPHVIEDGGKLKMWYSDYEQGALNYAESGDGISWTKSPSNPVLMPGYPGVEGQPVVAVGDGAGQMVLDGLTLTGGFAKRAGGVDASGADVTLRNCFLFDNVAYGSADAWAGGGVLGGWPLTIENSRIISNRVGSGAGGVRPGGPLVMVNSVVAENRGDAGIHANGDIRLVNATVANNDWDIIFNPQGEATLAFTNTIIYGHMDPNLLGWCQGRTCLINYSDIEGGWPGGIGNIDADPLFAGGGNYHLRPGSPCADAGTPTGAPADDLEGTPRDADPDMGAYELVVQRVYLPLVLRSYAP
jgi:hypothetical protein